MGLLLLLGAAAPALAHLGGDTGSVAADRRALAGELRSAASLQYVAHTITAATGTTVTEYCSAQGTVFAITWQGPTPPDLRTLFGGYFAAFQSATAASAASRAGAHRQLSLVQADLVVQAIGHPRSFRGRAYVPSLLPAGVVVDALP